MRQRLLALGLVWMGLAAAAPLPLKPPPPDLSSLVPFASAPLDKPPIAVPEVALPPPPVSLPPVPAAPIMVPTASKPTAFLPPPGTFPCAGAWLSASLSLECGRARFGKGEYEDALRALDQAVRSGETEVVVEARYWLGETLYNLKRVEQADGFFRQVAKDQPTGDYGPWALHASGWTALQLGDSARARDTFTLLLSKPAPAPLDVWARHGLGLAQYALGRYEEAERAWAQLVNRRVPVELARDILFWHGEALGRIGQFQRAADEVKRFSEGGPHPLLGSSLMRLGWWSLGAGRIAESAAVFERLLASRSGEDTPTVSGEERDSAEAGLAIALASSGDMTRARQLARGLGSRRSALAQPLSLRLAATALATGRPADAESIAQELLAGSVSPAARAWVLVVKGDARRAEGDRDEARTQYELARSVDAASPTGRRAALMVARTNFELREYVQVGKDLAPMLTAPMAADVRVAVLILQGEAAYNAGDYAKAATAFRRLLVEFPNLAEAADARLGLAWVALRQNQSDEARRLFVDFVQASPSDPRAVDALVLASELALASGSLDAGRELLDRIVATFGGHSRTEFARLNRAILTLRTGQAAAAQKELREWIGRAPFPPLLGRAHAALGVALLSSGKPDEAGKEFTRAKSAGVDAFATLGLGTVALAQARLDDATRELTEARDTGTAALAAVAAYGLAAVAWERGGSGDFKKPALAVLTSAPRNPMAPRLLYVLAGIGADERDWPTALTYARRLVTEFPDAEEGDDGLERVGAAAAKASAWPVALEAYGRLRDRYPQSPFVDSSRVAYAEALAETGKPEDAKRELDPMVATSTADPRTGRAWAALGRARELTGDRGGALDAFERADRTSRSTDWTAEEIFSHARLLVGERRYGQARATLQPALKNPAPETAATAAVGLADAYAAEGDHQSAVEYYMTAAYLLPESPVGRRALVAAGRSFTAMKQPGAATTVYRKLLAQANVPAELANAARQGLAELNR